MPPRRSTRCSARRRALPARRSWRRRASARCCRAPSSFASIPTSIPTCRGASSRSSARSRCGWARRSWSISARPTSRNGRSSAPRPITSRRSPPARGSTSCNASASPSSCCSRASRSTCPWYSSSIPRWTRIGATITSAPSRSPTPSSRPRRSGRRLCWAAYPPTDLERVDEYGRRRAEASLSSRRPQPVARTGCHRRAAAGFWRSPRHAPRHAGPARRGDHQGRRVVDRRPGFPDHLRRDVLVVERRHRRVAQVPHRGGPARLALRHDPVHRLRGAVLRRVLLGICFTAIQAFEYFHAPFGFRDNIYSSTFFMATGFHGFHVFVGTTFLLVCLFRAMAGQFKPRQHFGFEAAAWYWHFVDVVWLFLFFCIYWWGSGKAPIALH